MDYRVRIHKKGKIEEKAVEQGTNLLTFMRKNSMDVSSLCGGKGTCGKCRVMVNGLDKEPSGKEKELLGDKMLKRGYRLSCYNNINSDIDIFMDKEDIEANIVTDGKAREIKLEPVISKQYAVLASPDINDQRPDLTRAADSLERGKIGNSLDLIRKLPELLREDSYKVTFIYSDEKLISIEAGDTTGVMYGIAVDIGTTTIAAYLYDLTTGKRVDVYSVLNPQKKFGADVVSRIEYTMNSKEALDEMNNVIVSCMNEIIDRFVSQNNILRDNIYSIVFVGNTTMMHFLMKISARNIASSPFVPVTCELHRFKAGEMGININSHGQAVIFPSVSGYIGADTVAAVLSSGLYKEKKISLLIDIGTNGEIVLGNDKWMYACSAAAGPAFEGANIRNGVGGIKGAIDKVSFNPLLAINTIGNEMPLGICGSGIVDAVAGMLSTGIIDETGRIVDIDEIEGAFPEELKDNFVEIDGKSSFLLVKSEDSKAGTDIAVTQKDVRELQNAKAAIAAGIKILIKQAGIKVEDIDRVYLAGGFGSFININSAIKIGLIPVELTGRVESIGNAAGAGAIEGMLSLKMLKTAEEIKDGIKYIELSACHDFMDEYVECMMF